MEAWGANTHQVFAYFHWQHSQVQCEMDGPDFAAGFHVFTLIWKPGELAWAVDGVTQCTSHIYVPDVAMYLNMSTAVGGKAQPTDGTTRLPQTTDIDYVRIWKSV
jgi:beta-glucanase (GH16 family)